MFPTLISPEFDDKIFLMASEMIYDKNKKIWNIILEPGNELAAINSNINSELPTVKNIRNLKPDINEDKDNIYYKGGTLFSSGVILIVNDKFVMLQRSKNAPFDPGMWTCPAGRCSLPPSNTALIEFYEELAAFDSESAITFNIPGAADTEKNIYSQTVIRKKAHSMPLKEIQCKTADEYHNCGINIVRGNDTFYDGAFWAGYDISNNTLEIRLLAKASVDEKIFRQILFEDGELYNRKVDLFSIEEFSQLPLVPAMELLKAEVLKRSNKNNLR